MTSLLSAHKRSTTFTRTSFASHKSKTLIFKNPQGHFKGFLIRINIIKIFEKNKFNKQK